MSQTELTLQIIHDAINKLAQAVTEADILQAIEVYLKPQEPQWLGLLYLDTLPYPESIVLVAHQFYGETPPADPVQPQKWILADSPLAALFHTRVNSVLLIEDTAQDRPISEYSELVEAVRPFSIRSLAIIPLYCGQAWHGLLALTWTKPRQFSPTDQATYEAIAKPLAMAASSRRHLMMAKRLQQRSDTISRLYDQITQTKTLYELYERLSELAEKFGVAVKFLFRSNERGELRVVDRVTVPSERTLDLGSPEATARLAKAVEAFWWIANVEESSSALTDYLRSMDVQAYICLPFHVADRWLGSFVAGWHTLQHSDVDLEVILEAIAPSASTALAHHNLLDQLHKSIQFADSYLNAILKYAPIDIHTLDIGGTITYTNGRLGASFGEAPPYAVGQSPVDLFPESRELVEQMVRQALRGEELSEIVALRGRHLWVQYVPLKDDDGSVIGSVGITQDITRFVEAEAQLRALSHQLIEAQETERRTLAHELHDEVGQSLTAILYQLNRLERLSPGIDLETITQIQAIVKGLIVQIRELSHSLHPPVLDTYGLVEAVRWYCSHFTTQTQITVDLKISGANHRYSAETELTCYRVVQEALTNIARHAKTNRAKVRVWISERRVSIVVQDKGIGFDVGLITAKHTTYGLAAMRERISLLNGKLSITSSPKSGTSVCAEIPLPGG